MLTSVTSPGISQGLLPAPDLPFRLPVKIQFEIMHLISTAFTSTPWPVSPSPQLGGTVPFLTLGHQTAATKPYQGAEGGERGGDMTNI